MASVALTGTMQLRATEQEQREIGGALADAVSYFDDASPFIKLLNFLGPWAGVIDGLGNAIYDRIVYVSQHRRQPGAPPRPYPPAVTSPTPGANGRGSYEDKDDTIYAPDPGKVAGY